MMTNKQSAPGIIPKTLVSRRPERPAAGPVLRFTPTAWAKLLWFRDAGDTEIAGFGVAGTEDPLLVTEFLSIRQTASMVHVDLEDEAVAEYFDEQIDLGVAPEHCLRIWCHSHPGDCPEPSALDEQTFERVFAACDWAVMFIVARGGRTYARLRFHAGPGAAMQIPVQIDYHLPFACADHEAWAAEYRAHVRKDRPWQAHGPAADDAYWPEDLLEDYEFSEEALDLMRAMDDRAALEMELLPEEVVE